MIIFNKKKWVDDGGRNIKVFYVCEGPNHLIEMIIYFWMYKY